MNYDQPRDDRGRWTTNDAIQSYGRGGEVADIKKADIGKSKDTRAIAYAKLLNDHIAKNGTVHSNVLYRGLNLTPNQLSKLLSSEHINIDSITSFTDSEDTAKSFARGSSGYDSGAHVVIKATGVHAAPITNRTFTGESELLAGKGQKLKVLQISKEGRRTVIHAAAVR